MHREQSDRFVRACLSSKEIDEHPFGACILIGDESDDAMIFQCLRNLRRRAFFCNDLLTMLLSDAEDEIAEVGIIEGPRDTDGFEAEHRQCIAEYFPVSVVTGQHHHAFVIGEEKIKCRFEITDLNDLLEGVQPDESRREHRFDAEAEQSLHRFDGHLLQLSI